jgi:hypothetical protein
MIPLSREKYVNKVEEKHAALSKTRTEGCWNKGKPRV